LPLSYLDEITIHFARPTIIPANRLVAANAR
jgi:hypothetical protein